MKKNTKLKSIGIALLIGAYLTALFIQFMGSGLVVTEHLNQHIQSSDSHIAYGGTIITTYRLFSILPLVASAIAGGALIFVSRRHENPVA